jgi:hypothetical protein
MQPPKLPPNVIDKPSHQALGIGLLVARFALMALMVGAFWWASRSGWFLK